MLLLFLYYETWVLNGVVADEMGARGGEQRAH